MDDFTDAPMLDDPAPDTGGAAERAPAAPKRDSIVDNARYYEIPAATRISECRHRSCAKIIYWITYEKEQKDGTMKKVRQPIDIDVPDGLAPTAKEPGRGVSHFVTCPAADKFSRSNKSNA